MKKMTNLEELEHILQVLNKRLLPAFFFTLNPELFLKWQGNMCKQAALINVFILQKYLGDEYKIEVWEGFFEHEKLGSYNHCWNYCVHKTDPEKNIICDFTSTITYMNYCTQNDPTLHIGDNINSVVKSKIDMIGFEEVNIQDQLSQNEFYTGLPWEELKDQIIFLLEKAKLWKNEILQT